MHTKLASIALVIVFLLASFGVALAQGPTPTATPPGRSDTHPTPKAEKTKSADDKEDQDDDKDNGDKGNKGDKGNQGKKGNEGNQSDQGAKGAGRHAVFGTVSGKGSDSITVTTKTGAVVVTVAAGTKIHMPRKRDATLADIAVGDRVTANGTPTTGGLTAKQIMVTPGKPSTQHRVGKVTAYTAVSSITIETGKGESSTFALTAQTTIRNPKGSGVAVGDQVTIVARRDPSSDTATATGIVVHPQTNK